METPDSAPAAARSAGFRASATTGVVECAATAWDQPYTSEDQQAALRALEQGHALLFPKLGFPLRDAEATLFDITVSGRSKNVSLDPGSANLRGLGDNSDMRDLALPVMQRYAQVSCLLVAKLLTPYSAHLRQGRTSYRPVEIAGRAAAWRKDDTRLHVDSFPSSPTHGERILRVFTNVNPYGEARLWRLGDTFETVVAKFASQLPAPNAALSRVLHLLGLTRRLRSPYDHYMLGLHDAMKADPTYQQQAPQQQREFAAGSTWMVFTDCVPHAAMSGQYLFEQTFYLPVQAMLYQAQAPLRILERFFRRSLQ